MDHRFPTEFILRLAPHPGESPLLRGAVRALVRAPGRRGPGLYSGEHLAHILTYPIVVPCIRFGIVAGGESGSFGVFGLSLHQIGRAHV